jgi:diguanylate cyclase (GGDEF)-like protein
VKSIVSLRFVLIGAIGTALGAVAISFALEVGLSPLLTMGVALVLVCFLAFGWGRRLDQIVGFLKAQSDKAEVLRRLPPMGEDDIGRAARGVNTILTATTDASVDAIDSSLELAEKERELALAAALGRKTTELEQRLGERALLFELLREATEKTGMDEVLPSVAGRLSEAMRLRELAILVRDGDRFVIRAVHGFAEPAALIGRYIEKGEGISGEVTDASEPVVVRDVRVEPGYLAFWGAADKSGGFAAVPIRHGEENLGILALTRPEDDPLTDVEVRFLSAVAATLALTIRHTALVDELRQSSTHDELTGLANRRLLGARLKREIDRARRFETDLAVLMLDIDHFKQLNDRFGHPTGDAVLRDIARVLEEGVRSIDTVARAGGEEFVVVLPRTDAGAAERVADKLRSRISAHDVPELGGEARVTISLGVALLMPGESSDSLLARADRALYDAKDAGRDRVRLSRPAA